jgi:succinate-semialdehyde dehydrogenase / glutarate-semialdehyde dehydrogenase
MIEASDTIETVDPSTGQVRERYRIQNPGEIDKRVAAAAAAFPAWRDRGFAERAGVLRVAAELLESRKEEWARLMVEEMGKPIAAARAEAEKCAWVCRHYAERAERYLAPRTIETDASRSYVRYDPLGPVLAVMPWNFPFWQVFRFAAPGLMAGNVGLLKHASNTTGCAFAIERILAEAGLPAGGFQVLAVPARAVAGVVADERVRAVTLTGSEPAGRAVAATAADKIKKSVLELGGSDPFVVLADADVAAAAETGVRARMINSGQSCIAAKRFVVDRKVIAEFLEAFTAGLDALRVGDPMNEANDVGPLARKDLVDDLDDQVRRSVARGARLVRGGKRRDRPGFFYEPTLLIDVAPEHAAFREETFGPVAAVTGADGDDEALRLANATSFGLGASLWTRDLDRAERLAAKLEAGAVFVNGLVKSDPRLPFGGVKRSGYGRELSEEGIREFVNVKSVWIK